MPIEFTDDFWKAAWAHKNGRNARIKGGILAAGLGKRMEPLTVRHLPKPLFPVGGTVPMAELWVRRFVESGITDISMNLCVLSRAMKRHFGDGSKFGAQITYADEQVPTGTLGGICKHALGREAKRVIAGEMLPSFPSFKGSTIIVPSGDIVTNFGTELLEQLYEFHNKVGSAFTMVLVPIPWERRGDYGTAILESSEVLGRGLSQAGIIREFREKDPASPSNLNNASIYVIEMELLKLLDSYRTEATPHVAQPFYDFGKHVFPALLGKLNYLSLPGSFPLWGVQYEGDWYDVGQKRDYLRVNSALLNGDIDLRIPYEKYPWGYLGANTEIDFSSVTIFPPVLIGNNCAISAGAKIGPNAVIGDGWVIGRDACLRNSVLWQRYPFFTKDGREISIREREAVDRHEVGIGVVIDQCIIVGGSIQSDLNAKTVEVMENGELSALSIDYVPKEPRA